MNAKTSKLMNAKNKHEYLEQPWMNAKKNY